MVLKDLTYVPTLKTKILAGAFPDFLIEFMNEDALTDKDMLTDKDVLTDEDVMTDESVDFYSIAETLPYT